ncbi:MAG: hypothetical protein QHJ81_15565 [Anaerolineae bacterium]|nr:hypothetical protein [Anaerolineae bacterium]
MLEEEHPLPVQTTETPPKKPYEKPRVVYEAQLEVRAGSPLGVPPNPFDLGGMFGP